MIFRFKPILKSMIWGGGRLPGLKNLPQQANVGESWELSGVKGNESRVDGGSCHGFTISQLIEKYRDALVGESNYERFGNSFPLLVKFIDARENLSVQVHPNDEMALRCHNCQGKTEMWYVLDAETDAKIYSGLKSAITPDEYLRRVEEKSIMDVIAAYPSHKGDVFYLPAGRVHAIGGGNLLVEIQQACDITYRIYDYDRVDAAGNARQLHTEQAMQAIDYTVCPDYRTPYDSDSADTGIVSCDHFRVRRLSVDGTKQLSAFGDSFIIVICIEGACDIVADDEKTHVDAFDTLLVSADTKKITYTGNAVLLTVTN